MFSQKIIDKFWKHVDKHASCWTWKASKLPHGYGVTWNGRKSLTAHRFSYELHFGKIPMGESVLHTCDNPPCVNPTHLFLGTQLNNMRDMIKKGRRGYTGLQGEKHPFHKLTMEQVLEIRKKYSENPKWGMQTKLGKQYKVSPSTISMIVFNKNWTRQ